MSELGAMRMSFPRPGKALLGAMITLFAVWLAYAVALNWAGASEESFLLLAGNTERILHGEVWRLFTAVLLQPPDSPSGILFALLGLYFLAPTLEQKWGSGRMLRFLIFTPAIAYGLQMIAELLLPAALTERLIPNYWFSAVPVFDAISVAFALTMTGRVYLMFILPVSSRGLLLFVFGMNVLYVIVARAGLSGAIAPFGGMFAGWLLGSGTPSPLRRLWLKLRLTMLDAEARRAVGARKKRVQDSNLRVVEGGKRDKNRGPDGRLLN